MLSQKKENQNLKDNNNLNHNPKLLETLKVIEIGQHIAAPFASKLLADLGADVIKVEPLEGDVARQIGPFPNNIENPEKSGLFLSLNTSKLGITIDFDNKDHINRLYRLLETTDVLIEDQSYQINSKFRFDYDQLTKMFPKLIIATITPFGLTGPYKDYKANDLILFHMSSYAHIIASSVEDPNQEPPIRAGGHQSEFVSGLSTATATMISVFNQLQTHQGTHIDISKLESITMMPQGPLADAAFSKKRQSRKASDRKVGAIVAMLPTLDGYITISPREDHQWEAWLKIIDNPEWSTDPKYETRKARQTNWVELEKLLSKWTCTRKKEEIYRACQDAHVPAFPVNTAADLYKSKQLNSREFYQEINHPVAGVLPYTGFPYKLSQATLEIKGPAPTLGQHNKSILNIN
ncbi:MAG: CaiB/BaiF CoA transferase family protein [Dehalococcoidia bacterium]